MTALLRMCALAGVCASVVVLASREPRAHTLGAGAEAVVFTAEQATVGEKTFARACASCHNVSQMSGNRFRSRWAGTSVGELYDFISNSMPEANPGSLSSDEYLGVVAFFLSRSGYVAGEQPLPTDLEPLKAMIIDGPP